MDKTETGERIKELETVCAELYQVIGALAGHAGVFQHPDVVRALDNASQAKLVHTDLLPWPSEELKDVGDENKPRPPGWSKVITIDVERHECGLFMASSPDIKGLFAHGKGIAETLGKVEYCITDLASAGCAQSRSVLERAGAHQISPLTASDPSQGSGTTETKNAAPEPIVGRPGASDGEGTPCD